MAKYTKYFSFDHTAQVELSDDIESCLMVCSHERSGTHFLMNSLGECTRYNGEKYLNYDYAEIGSAVNFFSLKNSRSFLEALSNCKNSTGKLCMSSIIKSHFPVSLLGVPLPRKLKVAYIYRNPVDTLISYWRYLNSLDYFEGLKTNSPLKLAAGIPCGQSQRYQVENSATYFDRWAQHVTAACKLAKEDSNIALLNYNQLCYDYNSALKKACKHLQIEVISEPKWKYKDTVIVPGADIRVSDKQVLDLKNYCDHNIRRYKYLPSDILE